ncbi:O-antigen ligase domain-containing protein [Amycolatopsis sp. H20-H5]|uniref:O-antigen ligase domain-containing protein n=1 Tax=Amycolatopsis sp. H20-H5 TaxID=3046309 RepID=UPI002DB9FCF9|nr:O-antigen ligase domain-containing protein [Amycolatopsis sp. H20-H5]MEC3976539.1 O-antigen ligase domain-containing protein [Amycolatopsis sp. H20-H5]
MAELTGVRPGSPAGEVTAGPKTPKLVGLVWALLILNTLGSTGAKTVIPIPRSVIQLVTMGSLMTAFAVALALNPRLRFRPSAYLLLLSMLLMLSIIASAGLEGGYGALFRCFRMGIFVSTLWLLTRWWGANLTFVRQHIKVYGAVLVTVAIGLVVSPGKAMPFEYGGRLSGAVWPLTPPQVGQYAAVIIGLTALLWMGREIDRRSALIIIVGSLALLLLTHTRTATLGLAAGLLVAVLSLTITSARARKVFASTLLVVAFAVVVLGSLLQAWFLRGQSTENFSSLTGRAKVWDALLSAPRTAFEYLFGVGLTDKSYDGLPIDSSWLAVYHEQGYVGIAIVAAFLLVLVVVAVLRPPSLHRACAIFLITYCLSASYTEAGLGDASPYLLHLAVAAGLLAAPVAGKSRKEAFL